MINLMENDEILIMINLMENDETLILSHHVLQACTKRSIHFPSVDGQLFALITIYSPFLVLVK